MAIQKNDPSILDAIESGQISLDDALTAYRPPTGGERLQTFGAILGRAARDAYLSGTSAELRLAERGLAMIGADDAAEWMRGFADYVAPGGGFSDDVGDATGTSLDVPEAAANENSALARAFTQLLPEGLGSSLGIVALPGPRGLTGVALKGAMVGAGQQFVEAKAEGADDVTAWTAFAGGAALGATDAWSPLGRLFARADERSGGMLREILWEGLVKGGGQEFTQEVGQTIGENLLAGALYDEDREVLENVLDAGVGGALTGMLIGALGGSMRGRAAAPGQDGDTTQPQQPKPITEPDEATSTLARDLGATTLEEAPEPIKRYVEARGGRVAVGRGEGGASLRRPAAYLNGSIVLSGDSTTENFLDHEVAHLAFEQDPEGSALAQAAIDQLAPGLRESALEDYIQDSISERRRAEGRELTPEEESEIRSAVPNDEAFARVNEDFSQIVRLLRRNPQAFAKLDNPGVIKKIFRAVVDLGRKLTGKQVPDRERAALAGAWRSLGGTEKVSPEVGVRVAEILRDYLDSLVGRQQRTGKPDSSKVDQGPKYSERRRNPQENLISFRTRWRERGVEVDVFTSHARPDLITLSRIVVPKAQRGQGIGTKAMQDLVAYADANGQRIALSPSTDFGGSSVGRLRDFYKRFGFKDNAGRSRDFSISETMIREPNAGDGAVPSVRYSLASPRVRRSINELVRDAEAQSSWKTWYDRHQKVLVDLFGTDSDLFQKILSATSQATGVKGNVSLALKAYDQFRTGEPFTGYLPAVIKNLERIRSDRALQGAKISQYGEANAGNEEAIAVDRHIAMLFFRTKSPNRAQIEKAKQRIRTVADRLGWRPREVQAALWAANQVRLGTDPKQVQSYDILLQERADQIRELRSRFSDSGGTGESDGTRGEAARGDEEGPLARYSLASEAGAAPDEVAAARKAWKEQGTESPWFKRWFGDSKVVDGEGEPLVVYHGTTATNVGVMKPSFEAGLGIFFSDNSEVSETFRVPREYGEPVYQDEDGNDIEPGELVSAYLRIENPLVLDGEQAQEFVDDTALQVRTLKKARADGYDGVIARNVMEGIGERYQSTNYVVFRSSQVKSTGNVGTFDPKNPDIRYSQRRRKDEVMAARGQDRIDMVKEDVDDLLRGNVSPISEITKWVQEQYDRTTDYNGKQYALLILNELRKRKIQKSAKLRQTDTKDFKAWFGKSKGVDENGKPRVYYHGTTRNEEFTANTAFNVFKTKGEDRPYLGAFFSPDPVFADIFAIKNDVYANGRVYPVFLKFENPFDIRNPEHVSKLRETLDEHYSKILDYAIQRLNDTENARPWSQIEELSRHIKRAGFDAYYIDEAAYEVSESGDSKVDVLSNNVVVFKPNQIKSAIGNNGDFDINNDDIRYAVWRRALPMSGTHGMPWDVRDNLLRYAQDAWRGPGRWRDALATAGKVTESNDIVLMETLRRGGTLDVVKSEGANYVAPLREAISRGSVTVEEAGRYLLARAAPDRNRMILDRGGPADGSGMSDVDAARIVAAAQNGPNAAKYAEIADLFDKLTQRKLEIMEQYGLITPEAAQQYRSQEPFYAPMKTDDRAEVLYGEEGRGSQVGIGRTRRKEFRSATGRGSEADNPIIFATMDLMAAVERGMWNATTGRATLEMAREFSDPAIAVVDVPATQQTVVNGRVRTVPAMERANEVVVKENGIARVIRFGKGWEPVAEAIKGSDRGQADAFLAALRTATRTIAGLSTRWNPAFQPVNLVRDALNAYLNASSNFGPAAASAMINPKTLIWAAREIKNNGPWAKRFSSAGGPVAFLDLARTFEEEAQRTIKDIRRLQSPNAPWEMSRRYAGNVLKLLEAMGNISENASRLAAFKYAIENLGASDARAAQYAKNITTNFERRGSNQWMTSLFAFSNASIQGTERVAQALRTPWGQRAAASLVAGAFLLSYMNRITGGEDEDGVPRWDKVPDWQRRSNAVFLIGEEKLMIPMPFVWNIFTALGTEIERGAFGGQTPLDSTKAIGSAMAGSLNPLGGEADFVDTITPTLADPLVQIARNQDYAGRTIFPPWERGPDSGKAWDTTSPTMVAMAEGLNELSGGDSGVPGLVDVSPATLEFLFKQYLGGVGGESSRVLRLAEKIISGENIETQDVPVVRRFYGSLGLQEQRSYYKQRRALIETQVMREKAGEPYDKDLWRMRKRANRWDERISELEKLARGASGTERDRIRSELRSVFIEATRDIEEAMK